MSETKCQNFSDEFKAKVSIEETRGIKTVNVVARIRDAFHTGWFVEDGIRATGAYAAM